jgi:hypothetical protein
MGTHRDDHPGVVQRNRRHRWAAYQKVLDQTQRARTTTGFCTVAAIKEAGPGSNPPDMLTTCTHHPCCACGGSSSISSPMCTRGLVCSMPAASMPTARIDRCLVHVSRTRVSALNRNRTSTSPKRNPRGHRGRGDRFGLGSFLGVSDRGVVSAANLKALHPTRSDTSRWRTNPNVEARRGRAST